MMIGLGLLQLSWPQKRAAHLLCLSQMVNPSILRKGENRLASNSNPLEEQVGGSHYKTMKIQPIEFIQANDLGFCEGNAVKYLCRYKQKGGLQDLMKAKHYIEILIEMTSKWEAEQQSTIGKQD